MQISTASASMGDFLRVYSELAQEADAIVSIHVAAALRGTFAAADQAVALAAETPGAYRSEWSTAARPAWLVDSRSWAAGPGLAGIAYYPAQ